MNFLADEGVDRSVVDGLRKLSHDVYFVVDEVRSLDDEILLQLAVNEQRILITRDKDFGELVFRLGQIHTGVILKRLDGLDTTERAEMVCKLIQQYIDKLPKAFSVIQRGIIRIRLDTPSYKLSY
jgi:predicted nuclease of predicted toxin-antitoxin system